MTLTAFINPVVPLNLLVPLQRVICPQSRQSAKYRIVTHNFTNDDLTNGKSPSYQMDKNQIQYIWLFSLLLSSNDTVYCQSLFFVSCLRIFWRVTSGGLVGATVDGSSAAEFVALAWSWTSKRRSAPPFSSCDNYVLLEAWSALLSSATITEEIRRLNRLS